MKYYQALYMSDELIQKKVEIIISIVWFIVLLILKRFTYSKKDITPLGYMYIDKLENFTYIDTAHLSKKSFYSLAKLMELERKN